jgi:hypothetical protein
MRALILTAAISVAALMAGPQAASAQNEGRAYQRVSPGPPGGGQFLPSPTRNRALATTGRGGTNRIARRSTARQMASPGPAGGGQFLPSSTRNTDLSTTGRGGTSRRARQPVPPGPPGGGQFLPPQTR